MTHELAKQMAASMKFRYDCGEATPIANGHCTGWRAMSFSLFAQNMGHPVDVELKGAPGFSAENGEGFIIPKGTPHRITLRPGGSSVSRWAHFDLTLFETLDALKLHKTPAKIRGKAARTSGDLCVALSKVANDESLEGMARTRALGFKLAETIFGATEPLDNYSELCETFSKVSPALRLIESGRHGAASLESMAKSCNLSVSRFCALFKAATGVSPSRYQAKARLLKAKSLLLGGGRRIGEVAEELGYADQFHFSKAFKKEFDASPTDWLEAGKVLPGTGF